MLITRKMNLINVHFVTYLNSRTNNTFRMIFSTECTIGMVEGDLK